MAQRTVVFLEDDIDGSEAHETVQFGLDGQGYELDLNEKNASEMRDALAPYVAVARRAGSRVPVQSRRGPSRGPNRSSSRAAAPAPAPSVSAELDPKQIRAWATEQGITVNARGRIKADVIEQYRAAH